MKIKRAAAIPLITHDPFFSIWSNSDNLNDKDTVHWSGIRQKIEGYIIIDDERYCFMGAGSGCKKIKQNSIDVTALSTKYKFENDMVTLDVKFLSPLILSDMDLVSRPCTYIDFGIEKKKPCKAFIELKVSRDLVTQDTDQVVGGTYKCSDKFNYAVMGRANQRPLGSSGDRTTVDWGYVYLASDIAGLFSFDEEAGRITWNSDINNGKTSCVIAFDDLLSINYFGEWRKAFWTEKHTTIIEAIKAAFDEKEEILAKTKEFDEELYAKAFELGGERYAYLCNLSYRQTVAAHKLIRDEKDNIIFLSKENDSNGCIGTVDVSYPSVPLFLLYNTEYVKGMLRPIFRFYDCDVWEYDYAPHDVGRYPYAWGQVYGVNREHVGSLYPRTQGRVRPPFYSYPAGNDIYEEKMQMPVEECGNMLIMTAIICILDGNPEFAKPYKDTLEKWVNYLVEFGLIPGEQLCTDDFAGHLANNTNLSVKAISGIEAYSLLQGQLGDEELKIKYHNIAKQYAKSWEEKAKENEHYSLAFGDSDTWSLKYNLVWDKIFKSDLFSDDVYKKEMLWYFSKMNKYGVPLDNRENYSKSDWICWCSALLEKKEDFCKFITPVADYLENTKSRVPFSDWYDTITGKYERFIGRSVQGGIFMPIFKKFINK